MIISFLFYPAQSVRLLERPAQGAPLFHCHLDPHLQVRAPHCLAVRKDASLLHKPNHPHFSSVMTLHLKGGLNSIFNTWVCMASGQAGGCAWR